MTDDFKKDLISARDFYLNNEYEKSLEIYEKCYNQSPELFDENHRTFYAWAIYQCHIKNFHDEDTFFKSAQFITYLTKQADLTKSKTCPYIFTVFKVFDLLVKQNDYFTLSSWLDMIDPELLDETRVSYDNLTFRSRREKYFDYASKTYLRTQNFEKCIEISEIALNSLETFTNYSDTWHRWRIAKSLKGLGEYEKALKYLDEVSLVKQNWFIYKEIAENHYLLNDDEKALENVSKAVLTNDSIKVKVNLYKLISEILNDTNHEMADRHMELYCIIKEGKENDQLVSEINQFWINFKFKDKELCHGTITRYFEDKNYGFITTADNKSIFFHRDEFNGKTIRTNKYVSFYTENSFDKSKNKKSIKAVYINEVI